LLARLRHVVLGALEHPDYPFAMLVERLRPTRDPSHAAFFHAVFALNKPHRREEQAVSLARIGETGGVDGGGLALECVPSEHRASVDGLVRRMGEIGDVLLGGWEYNTGRFGSWTIARMARQFERLLEAAIDAPDTRLSQLPLVDDEDRRQIVEDFNA